jgi:hypothetical protein
VVTTDEPQPTLRVWEHREDAVAGRQAPRRVIVGHLPELWSRRAAGDRDHQDVAVGCGDHHSVVVGPATARARWPGSAWPESRPPGTEWGRARAPRPAPWPGSAARAAQIGSCAGHPVLLGFQSRSSAAARLSRGSSVAQRFSTAARPETGSAMTIDDGIGAVRRSGDRLRGWPMSAIAARAELGVLWGVQASLNRSPDHDAWCRAGRNGDDT